MLILWRGKTLGTNVYSSVVPWILQSHIFLLVDIYIISISKLRTTMICEARMKNNGRNSEKRDRK